MTGLLVKCLVLIGVIHGLRSLGRRIGPRASGLLLGLPSSTALLLILCGWEKGCAAAIQMAEASLLGLVAAVAMPLVYAQAVRRGWRLAGALTGALTGYLAVASGLGFFRPVGALECLLISVSAILVASYLAGRIGVPHEGRAGLLRSERGTLVIRTAIPAAYVALIGITGGAASPSWTGLVSTFPSMSTVLLAVTHLEEGPAEASQIAKTLPPANLSTVVFLAAFRFGCPVLGLGWGAFWGYVAALINLAVIELAAGRVIPRGFLLGSLRQPEDPSHDPQPLPSRTGLRKDVQSSPRHFGRPRPARGRRFAPLVEALPC